MRPRPAPRWLLVAIAAWLLALSAGCKKKPTVEGKVAEHRGEIVAFLEKVRAVHAELASAPGEAQGFAAGAAGKVATESTLVIAEMDFDAIRTEPSASDNERYNWRPGTSVRPFSSFDLGTLVDEVRAKPKNPPNSSPNAIAVMDNGIQKMRATRHVAVVRTDVSQGTTVRAGTFKGAAWKGRVFLWDLEARRWIGSVAVSVDDRRQETTVGRAVTSASEQLNRRFNAHIERAVRHAIETNSNVDGFLGDVNSSP